MIHPDGIEVYLKPHGTKNEDVKFAEFPLRNTDKSTVSEESTSSHCIVLAQQGNFDVVLRFLPHFRMYSATAIADKVLDGRRGRGTLQRLIIQRSRVFEQRVKKRNLFRQGQSEHKKHLMMRDASKALSGDFDGKSCAPLRSYANNSGSILVIIQRVNPEWCDTADAASNTDRLYGPGDPTLRRKFRKRKTKDLKSENGKPYLFEFRYRSEAYIRTLHGTLSQNRDGTAVHAEEPIRTIGLISDPDFSSIRDQDKKERQKTHEAFKRRQAMIEMREKDEPSSVKSSDKQPRKTAARGKKHKPEFCDCGEPSHNHRKPAARSIQTARPRLGLPAMPGRKDANDERPVESMHLSDLDTSNQQASADVEPMPQSCVKCKKLKVPKSRRPAFLRKWYANAVASNGGEDEEDDKDDEESSRVSKPDSAEISSERAGESDENSPNRHTSRTNPEEIADRHEATYQRNEVEDDTEVAEVAEQDQNNSYFRDSEPNSPVPAFSAPESLSVPSPTIPQLAEVIQRQQEEDLWDTGPPEDSTPQDQPSFEIEDNDSEMTVQTTAAKRRADTPAGQHPSKQPRIDIDLTIDDDDEIAIIKAESRDLSEFKTQIGIAANDEEDDLQEQLDDVRRQKRLLQLELKEAELQRKIKANRKKAPTAAVKMEEVIKIED